MKSILPFGPRGRSICRPILNRIGLLPLLTLFLFPYTASSQNDSPCECSQRWTESAAWNPNGSVNDNPPQNYQPKGVVNCGSGAGTQSNINTEFGCTYNPAAFPVTVMNCTDPITGLPIPTPVGPTIGAPIIFFNFDVRANAGTFEIQINDNNSQDNIGWALYYSASPTAGTGPGPQYQSGDCNNLIFYLCGSENPNTWMTFYTPTFSEPTNWYLVIWDQQGDTDLDINNFKARFGCGGGTLYCHLETMAPTTTCHPNGTYTVNVPISGINGNYVGTDPNALNSPSAPVCLQNIGAGGPTSGIISLTYPYGTAYNINIGIDVTGPCPDPLNPNSCTANVAGAAPDCCTPPPPCTISGPSEVCPSATGIVFTGPAGMDSYNWMVMGNASIIGSSTGQSVTVNADGVCGGGFCVSLEVEQFTCVNSCVVDVSINDFVVPTANCPVPETVDICQTQSEVDAAFATWLSGFTAMDNCGPPVLDGIAGAMPPSFCGGTTTINFSATDGCNNVAMCSSTFTVNAAPVAVLTCPADATEVACQTQDEINTKFNLWLASATFSGGCNAVLNNDNTGAPSACGGTTTVTFTLTSGCEAPVTCTRTFTVSAAPVVNLSCPANVTEAACQTQADIDTKYAAWLATASVSGGCNASLSNNSTGAPLACGGTATVTFTVTSSCETPVTCTRTFTVTAAPVVNLTCPANVTEAACQTQADIDTKYAAWLASATVTGGCNGSLTNNSTGAPLACGGTATVTFTVTSSCETPVTCTRTFTVTAAPVVNLTCPANVTEAACQTQAEIDAKYAAWLASATVTGGCNAVLTNNSSGPPPACGGIRNITFTVTSSCQTPVTCTRSFMVTFAPLVNLTCPDDVTEAACQTQAEIDTKYAVWLASASAMGGCNAIFTNNSTGAPNACGGASTVTFTVSSDCEPDAVCSATFTVTAAPVVNLTCPANVMEAACQTQAEIDTKYTAWLATATASGGCNAVFTNNSTGAPNACGGASTVTFTVSSDCEPDAVCSATFTVTAAPVVNLTCPANVTEAACQTQAEIDTKYAAWLATVSVSGGCNTNLTNNSPGAPNACGGASTVTFTVTSDCEPDVVCSATFTVTAASPVVLNCPVSVTEAACQSQADIDNKFNTWLNMANATGGCNTLVTNDNTGAPDACGGSVTVTFTASSSCEGPVTCTRTFTVEDAPPVTLTCPAPKVIPPFQTQAFIDAEFAAWLASASASGGCNGVLTNNNTGAPSVCGGSTTVTFTYTSTCPPFSSSCDQTFTVEAVPPGIRIAKYFAGIAHATSGIAGNFDIITEIIVENVGTPDLNNLSLLDNLGAANNFGSAFVAITGAPQIVAVSAKGAVTNAASNPTANASYNGTGDLLAGGGLLKSNQRFVLRFRFEVNPDAPGAPAVLKNQAEARGTVATCFPPFVVSDLSDDGDNPLTTNPGYLGDSGGSNDPTLLSNCWALLNNGLGCNDLIQVSLNQNCEVWLTPSMVLEGEYAHCANANLMPLGAYYQVFMVTDAWGAPVPDLNPATPNVYEISGSYIGQYLTVKIKEKVYKNTCWGQIFIEDKMAPTFTCPSTPVQVFCTANLANVPPPVATDNCDPNPVITLVGQQVIDNNICDDGIYTVRRTYKATDNQGNMSANCTININVTRPPVDFPDDITWTCTQYAARPNITNPTKLHPSITDVDPIELGIDVSPTLPDSTLANTGSGIVNVSVSTICAYNVLHSDQVLAVCGTSFKIKRTWTVVDWCTGNIITTGVGGEDNVQFIKIADKVGPAITRAPFSVSANVPGAYPQPCKSTGFLLAPTAISDNCNAVTIQIITTIGEAIYLNGVDGTNGGNIPAPGLSVGTHQVTYIATDACGNVTSISVPVTVVDDITPTAICVGFTVIDLPSGPNPTAVALANVFNTGSTDNCCLHHFEVRRMTDPCNDGHNDTVFGPSVVFCCEDVGSGPIMVVFRAFDCFGNFNDCMVEVTVNDSQPPVLATCPPNQRITCDYYVNNFETQLSALGNNQTAKSQLLDANFGQPMFVDNCNSSMVVTRTFASNLTQCKEGTLTRTWKATDAQGLQSGLCTQNIFVDHVSDFVVSFPKDTTVTCGQSVPNFGEPTIFFKTCEMVAISHEDGLFETVPGACYKFIRTWEVVNWCVQGTVKDQEVVEVPESQLGLPFPQCDLDGDGDCDSRTFRDSWTATHRPSVVNATDQFGPDTDPDSDPWDGVIIYHQTIKIIDTVAPVFVSCNITDVCIQDSTACAATFTLPTPTVIDCSSQLTITAFTPGLGAGFGPFTSGPGTFVTTYTANDGCNNSTICVDTFVVKDCKAPNIVCQPLVTNVMSTNPPMVSVNANQLDAGSTDNCSSNIQVSFSPDVNDNVNIYMCEDEGIDTVEVWFTDDAGNQDFCVTTIEIQDNNNVCADDTLVVSLGGQILNENNSPVGNVSVILSGLNGTVMTGASGSYYFPNALAGQDITIVPNKDNNPLAGVTTYDLVLMSKHILNIELLNSPYKMIAADINKSGTITTFDLVELRKLILHINANFPSNTAWRFVEKSYVFPKPTNPWFEAFPEIISINDIPSSVLDADFVAVKIGDINTSYNFDGDVNEERSNGTLIFETQNQKLEAGQTYSLNFRAKDFEAVGYQFTLDFDTDLLEFVEIGEGEATASNFGLTKLEEGAITASWNEHGESVTDMADFTLSFKAKTSHVLSKAIWLSDRFTRTEAYSPDGELLDIRLQFAESLTDANFELFQNRPNPFGKETIIGFKLPQAGQAQLTITDATGKVLKVVEKHCEKGYNEVRLTRETLGISAGILYYRLASGAETATKMMLLID